MEKMKIKVTLIVNDRPIYMVIATDEDNNIDNMMDSAKKCIVEEIEYRKKNGLL